MSNEKVSLEGASEGVPERIWVHQGNVYRNDPKLRTPAVEYVRARVSPTVDEVIDKCPECGHDFVATNPEVYDCRVAPYLDMGDPVICGCDNDFHVSPVEEDKNSGKVEQ